MVRRLHSTCRDHHTKCSHQRNFKGLAPTRLIDVGSKESPTVTVVDSKDCPIYPTSYTTLSHRWAPDARLRLDKEDSYNLRQGYIVQELPTKFRWAVYMTRSIGVRYLWIDSMCIIQDDVEDWRRESEKMASYYGNSQVNLAVLTLSSNEQSKVTTARDFIVKTTWSDTIPAEYYVYNWDFWQESIVQDELLSRGWILQERYLSPRILFLGRNEYFWECRTSVTWESLYSPLPTRRDRAARKIDHDQYGSKSHRKPSTVDLSWYHVVIAYSKCRLTYLCDRLAAIAGVADVYGIASGTSNTAGLRLESLLTDMHWIALRPGQRTPIGTAPTWSWASTDAPIHWALPERGRSVTMVTLIDAKTTNLLGKSQDKSPVTITLKGPLLPATIASVDEGTSPEVSVGLKGLTITQLHLDISLDLSISEDYYVLLLDAEDGTDTLYTSMFFGHCWLLRLERGGSDHAYSRVGYVDLVYEDIHRWADHLGVGFTETSDADDRQYWYDESIYWKNEVVHIT